MIPQLVAAVSTVQQVGKHTLFAVFRLWRTAFCFLNQLLDLFKGITVNNRFVNILEYHPVFFWVIPTLPVFVGFGIGFEVDNIATIFLF